MYNGKTFIRELNKQNQTSVDVNSTKLEGFFLRARSLVVSDLRSETKGSRFEPGYQLCAEVTSLQQSPG